MTTKERRGILSAAGTLLRGLGALLAFVVMLALGVLFLGAGVYGLRNSSTDYEPVEAIAVSTRPSVTPGASDTSTRNTWSISLSVSYRYEVDGVSYPGLGRLDFGREGSGAKAERLAAAAAARYAPGTRFEALVDPDDPTRSALERRGVRYAVPALTFGVMILATLFGSVFMTLRDAWRRRLGVAAEPASDRWLAAIAAVTLVVLLLAAIAIGMQREPLFWILVLALLAVYGVRIVLDRRGRGAS